MDEVRLPATVTPFRVCFVTPSTPEWVAVEYTVDVLFFTDLCLQFFIPYRDEQGLVLDHWQIAKHYLKSWFPIDLISILVSGFDFLSLDAVCGAESAPSPPPPNALATGGAATSGAATSSIERIVATSSDARSDGAASADHRTQ